MNVVLGFLIGGVCCRKHSLWFKNVMKNYGQRRGKKAWEYSCNGGRGLGHDLEVSVVLPFVVGNFRAQEAIQHKLHWMTPVYPFG
jgi:hypothetical protein